MKKGDRVAIAMRNMPEWCFAWIAISQAGGICVPLNGWWREKVPLPLVLKPKFDSLL